MVDALFASFTGNTHESPYKNCCPQGKVKGVTRQGKTRLRLNTNSAVLDGRLRVKMT